VPASLGPGLRTVSGAKRSLGATLAPRTVTTMTGEERDVRKSDLARALAAGISAKKWGEKYKVKKSTAYDWAKDPK
jgi:hypothetical protein